MTREMEKLERSLGGIKNLGGIPDVIFVVDIGHERNAVREARILQLPIIGIVDSNHSPEGIDYMIAGNDDSIRAISYYTREIANAVLEAKASISTKKISKEKDIKAEAKKPVAKTEVAAETEAKKPVAKKPVTKTEVAAETEAKKPVAKKPVAKAEVAAETEAKKPVAKKPVAKKTVAKKPVAKKPVAKKPVAKKPVAKKTVAKKTVAKKTVAKKATANKQEAKDSEES